MDGRLSDQRMTILDSRSAQMNGGWPISIENTKWGATFKVLKWTIVWSFLKCNILILHLIFCRHMYKLQLLYKYTCMEIHTGYVSKCLNWKWLHVESAILCWMSFTSGTVFLVDLSLLSPHPHCTQVSGWWHNHQILPVPSTWPISCPELLPQTDKGFNTIQ